MEITDFGSKTWTVMTKADRRASGTVMVVRTAHQEDVLCVYNYDKNKTVFVPMSAVDVIFEGETP